MKHHKVLAVNAGSTDSLAWQVHLRITYRMSVANWVHIRQQTVGSEQMVYMSEATFAAGLAIGHGTPAYPVRLGGRSITRAETA